MRPLRRPIGRLVAVLGVLAATIVGLRRADVAEVRGRSMAPALEPGDRLLVLRLRRAPRAGDIVLAPDPREPTRELVKRVAAVDASGVRLQGDNEAFSTDARVFGAVSAERVRWRAVARIWPLGRAGRIRRPAVLELLDDGGEPACALPESLIAG